jgi:hypothetical protein
LILDSASQAQKFGKLCHAGTHAPMGTNNW